MYITLKGSVSPCWKTVNQCETWSKERSLLKIWHGNKFAALKKEHRRNRWPNRCGECAHEERCGVKSLARAYDHFTIGGMPSLIEIELSNVCNLMCTMCDGELSSKIRRYREKLPPIPQLYDEEFLKELKFFLHYLEELRINGGEPFAQKIAMDLMEMAPNRLKIVVATNGTILNDKVIDLIDRRNIHFNISIDSLEKKRYESIRVGADFDQVMKNLDQFIEFDRKTCLMVNPMRNNWTEMVEFWEFAQSKGIDIHYNTILHPEHLALKTMEKKTIRHVYEQLEYHAKKYEEHPKYAPLGNLLQQIHSWGFTS